MFTMVARNLVKDAAKFETDNARKVYGEKFNSIHEGYSVLLEEIEECESMAKAMDVYRKELWENIKQNDDVDTNIERIKDAAMYCALEALQVMAVCNKIQGV